MVLSVVGTAWGPLSFLCPLRLCTSAWIQSNPSSIILIFHRLEMVASSIDMVSRLEWSLLMGCAIKASGRPISTVFDRDPQVQLAPTSLGMICYTPLSRIPCCSRIAYPQASDGALVHSRIRLAPC